MILSRKINVESDSKLEDLISDAHSKREQLETISNSVEQSLAILGHLKTTGVKG